ncbi:hypothetical protein AMTR_s00085p00180660, partial [Amborella trichopoda]
CQARSSYLPLSTVVPPSAFSSTELPSGSTSVIGLSSFKLSTTSVGSGFPCIDGPLGFGSRAFSPCGHLERTATLGQCWHDTCPCHLELLCAGSRVPIDIGGYLPCGSPTSASPETASATFAAASSPSPPSRFVSCLQLCGPLRVLEGRSCEAHCAPSPLSPLTTVLSSACPLTMS